MPSARRNIATRRERETDDLAQPHRRQPATIEFIASFAGIGDAEVDEAETPEQRNMRIAVSALVRFLAFVGTLMEDAAPPKPRSPPMTSR